MKIVRNSFILIVSLISTGCKPTNDINMSLVQTMSPNESDKNIKIPKTLIKIIEKDYLNLKREDKNLSNLTEAQILNSIPRKFLSLKSIFAPVQTHSAILRSTLIKSQNGGGIIDLRDIFNDEKGQFIFQIGIDWEELGFTSSEVRKLKVHFISHAKKRKILKEEWGSGCDKFFDITNLYKSTLEGSGIELSLSEQRHLSVLAGSFVFSFFKDDELYISTMTFVDNRYPKVYCENIKSL